MDFEERFTKIKRQLEQAQLEQARLQERVSQLSIQKDSILQELKSLGINDPDELPTITAQLEKDIETELVQVETSLKELSKCLES